MNRNWGRNRFACTFTLVATSFVLAATGCSKDDPPTGNSPAAPSEAINSPPTETAPSTNAETAPKTEPTKPKNAEVKKPTDAVPHAVGESETRGDLGSYAGQWVLADMKKTQSVVERRLKQQAVETKLDEALLSQAIEGQKNSIEGVYKLEFDYNLTITGGGSYTLLKTTGSRVEEEKGMLSWDDKNKVIHFNPQQLYLIIDGIRADKPARIIGGKSTIVDLLPFGDSLIQSGAATWCLVRKK